MSTETWIRLSAACSAVAAVLVVRLWGDAPEERDPLLYRVVFALGYGHLLGSAWAARRGVSLRSWRTAAWVATGTNAFLLYGWALHRTPLAALPLFALTSWHSVENDIALGGRLRGRPSPVERRTLPLCLAWLAALVGIAQGAGAPDALELTHRGLPELPAPAIPCLGALAAWRARSMRTLSLPAFAALLGCLAVGPLLGRVLRFPEAFALMTLYHVASWGILAFLRGAPSRRRAVVAFHLVPLGLVVAPIPSHVAELVFSPALYLFWSTAHVFETLASRRRRTDLSGPPRGRAPGRRRRPPGASDPPP